MRREGKIILTFIVSLWLAVPIYLILHEGGHVLVAALCGAKIVEFNLLQGYVVVEGGTFNELSLALFYAAGLLVPVVVFIIYLILYNSKFQNVVYKVFSGFFTGVILFAIGVWVVVPILYLLGGGNPNDDVIQLIKVLKINPLVVSIFATLLMGICGLGIWKKRILQNAYYVLKS